MGRKYIIKLPENTHWVQWILESTEDHHPYMDFRHVEDLTPYIEPDLDAIKQEEYEKGYKTAKVQCDIQTEKDLREVGERHYQKGLSDAWDAARTLWNTPNRKEIFGYTVFSNALMSLTGQEVIEKIRQYEQEKEEQIQVGDEITDGITTAIVTKISGSLSEPVIQAIELDGEVYENFENGHKTGRHFPEIAEVLQKMKEA